MLEQPAGEPAEDWAGESFYKQLNRFFELIISSEKIQCFWRLFQLVHFVLFSESILMLAKNFYIFSATKILTFFQFLKYKKV